MLFVLLAADAWTAEAPEGVTMEREGASVRLRVRTYRPMDAVAAALRNEFGLVIGAEDPALPFPGDWMDASRENPKLRPGTMVPKRWGFAVSFPVNAAGQPVDVRDLLRGILLAANAANHFDYRLEEDGVGFAFVPQRTWDAGGRSVAVTPLLDRRVTIPLGRRRRNESAQLMAQELSRQTGLQVSCCQSVIAGYPWGMEEELFGAEGEAARSVLRRLGLKQWDVRCDRSFCFIEVR